MTPEWRERGTGVDCAGPVSDRGGTLDPGGASINRGRDERIYRYN